MIAAAAWPRFVAGEFAPTELTAEPGMVLGRSGDLRTKTGTGESGTLYMALRINGLRLRYFRCGRTAAWQLTALRLLVRTVMLVGAPEAVGRLSPGQAARWCWPGAGEGGLSLSVLLGGRWRRLGHALDAFSKASQSFAETFAELWQPPGSEEQKATTARMIR